jgi:outer membrane protein OmpA-like peptidoglycan-associated protein
MLPYLPFFITVHATLPKPKHSSTMNFLQKLTKPLVILLILAMTSLTWGCESSTNAGRGAGIGATTGGIIGGIIGSNEGSWVKGALIGAVIGGAGGALIGNYMDKQAAEIDRDVEGARVERVGEGIRVIFDSGILFSTGSSTITSDSRFNIEKLARILNRYNDTSLVIEGHTDTIGSEEANQSLSERRAESVANLLEVYGVSSRRLSPVGYGETRPVSSNETEYGRKLNRRVEVLIYANDDLKHQADSGHLRY